LKQREAEAQMARTKAAAQSGVGRKSPRTDAGPAAAAAAAQEVGEDEEQPLVEDCDDDGLDDEEDHDLLVNVLRELRGLQLVAPRKHEIKRVNRGVCGMPECKEPGGALACITCGVRLCRNTWCWNQHINYNRGNTVSKKQPLTVCEDQGEKKKTPGRAHQAEE
jgi:hypothetical protein